METQIVFPNVTGQLCTGKLRNHSGLSLKARVICSLNRLYHQTAVSKVEPLTTNLSHFPFISLRRFCSTITAYFVVICWKCFQKIKLSRKQEK